MSGASLPQLFANQNTGRIESLLLLQRYCTREACFWKAKPDEEQLERYEQTDNMISGCLSRGTVADEDVLTVAANMILILHNTSLAVRSGKRGGGKPLADCQSVEYDADAACRYLSEYWARKKFSREALKLQLKKRLSIIVVIILVLTTVLSVFTAIQSMSNYNDYSQKASVVIEKNFWQKYFGWLPFVEQPHQPKEEFGPKAERSLTVCIISSVLSAIMIFLAVKANKKKNAFMAIKSEELQQSSDFQKLLDLFKRTGLIVAGREGS